MKQIIFLASVFFLVTSCNNPRPQTPEKSGDTNLSFGMTQYTEKSRLTNAPETKITADIPIAESKDKAVAEKINHRIFEAVKYVIGDESDTSTDYTTLFSSFVGKYEKFISDFPDSPGGWEAIVKGSVEYQASDIVNIRLDSYTFTGGAHGNTYVLSFFFNPENGKELFMKDIITDTLALERIAETKFREKYNIPTDKSINSTGFSFENDKFSLPQNMFITNNGLLLYYNTYEIAAYAEGAKEVNLPLNEVKDILSVKIQ